MTTTFILNRFVNLLSTCNLPYPYRWEKHKKFFEKIEKSLNFRMGKKSSSHFSDVRLDKTFSDLLDAMVSRYSVILRQLSQDSNSEVRYQNFIKNPKVTANRLLQHHWSLSQSDWNAHHMLVISDTSTLSFPYRADREELGEIGGVKPKTKSKLTVPITIGIDIHPSIFVNASTGGLHGLGAVDIIKRPIAKTEADQVEREIRRKMNPKLPFEQKERYKWLNSPIKAIENAPDALQYTLIGDRETDIYDLMYRTLEHGHDFVYRSNHNRRVFPLTQKENLSDVMNRWNIEFSYRLTVEQTKDRSKHEANLQVKYGLVSIARPKTHMDKTLPTHLPIYAVQVKEHANTVFTGEKPINWLLFTSHPVTTRQQALQIIQWYLYRWIIEELFRTLKRKGLNIEASEVESFHGLTNLTPLALLATSQTMQLVRARKGKTNQKIEDVFFEQEQQCLILLNEKLQGKTEKTQNPYPIDSLAFGAWIIARLGGWKGYQSKRPPGPITMTRGLTRFFQILQGIRLML